MSEAIVDLDLSDCKFGLQESKLVFSDSLVGKSREIDLSRVNKVVFHEFDAGRILPKKRFDLSFFSDDGSKFSFFAAQVNGAKFTNIFEQIERFVFSNDCKFVLAYGSKFVKNIVIISQYTIYVLCLISAVVHLYFMKLFEFLASMALPLFTINSIKIVKKKHSYKEKCVNKITLFVELCNEKLNSEV